MNAKLFALPGLAISISISISAQTLPLDPAVRTGKLTNGFTYFIRHNEEPKNRVVFYLVNKVGSVLEDDDQRGLAHFMEHMSFNGTRHFPRNELIDYLQKAGVRFGADINAYTGFDETVYQLPIPSDKPELVRSGIEIMHDWAHGATLDPAEIEKERGVVLEEKRLGKGADDRMRNQYLPVVLNHSRYAERLPIGTDSVLMYFKTGTIRRFYEDWYRPDLQAVIVVGDIDAEQMEKTIQSRFADLKNPAVERPRPDYSVPLIGSNQFVAVTDPEATETQAEILVKQPQLPLHTVPEYRANTVRQLVNGMLGERYEELLRDATPPFVQGGAGISEFLGKLDAYGLSVTAKPGELEKGFKALWRENEKAIRFGFTATELDRGKAGYINQYASMLKEKDKTPSESFVREYLEYFLHGTASPGIGWEYEQVKKDLSVITLEEVNAALRSAAKTTDRDVLILAPQKDKTSLPPDSTVTGWMKSVEAENLTAFDDATSTDSLLQTAPVPGQTVRTTINPGTGTRTLVLSNGIRVVLKPTTFKNDEIQFSGFAPGGTSLYPDSDYSSAAAANGIPSYGAGNYNATALGKYLSSRQLAVQVSLTERTESVRGISVNKDIETALQLLYAYLTEPRVDSAMFAGTMARYRAGLANRADDPESVFEDTVSAVLGNYSVRRTGPSLAKLDQINLGKAYAVYRERFAHPGDFTFVFVGSFDTATLRPLLEKYLGGLPATGKGEAARDLHLTIPPGRQEKTVYKGSEPKASVNLVFSGPFDYGYDNKLKMEALREVLEIRLLERLREEESGVYSPSVRLNTAARPTGRFSLIVEFGCAPQNVEKLIASALEEMARIRTTGPKAVNVEKFRAETRRTTETALKTNDFWLSYLSGQLQDEAHLDQIGGFTKSLNAITPEALRKMAAKYLDGSNYIRLVLLPSAASKQ